MKPTFRFLCAHPAHWIALGAGSGLSPKAPGTAGTVFAWLTFWLLERWISTPGAWALWLSLTLLIGWWASTLTARHMSVNDPSSVVIDEIVAFWLMLWLIAPSNWWQQTLAFALFRYFDAAKPGPVRWADQYFKGQGPRGGWGIMFDDLVAAICALAVYAAVLALYAYIT